jgi:hypothetical protein
MGSARISGVQLVRPASTALRARRCMAVGGPNTGLTASATIAVGKGAFGRECRLALLQARGSHRPRFSAFTLSFRTSSFGGAYPAVYGLAAWSDGSASWRCCANKRDPF